MGNIRGVAPNAMANNIPNSMPNPMNMNMGKNIVYRHKSLVGTSATITKTQQFF